MPIERPISICPRFPGIDVIWRGTAGRPSLRPTSSCWPPLSLASSQMRVRIRRLRVGLARSYRTPTVAIVGRRCRIRGQDLRSDIVSAEIVTKRFFVVMLLGYQFLLFCSVTAPAASCCCFVLSRLRSAGRGSPGEVGIVVGSLSCFTAPFGASATALFHRSPNCRQRCRSSVRNASHLKFAVR